MDASETRLQKATKETNVGIRSRNSSLSSLSSVYFSPLASPTSEASNFHRRQQSNRVGVGFSTFRYLRFLLFTFSLLAALLRIGLMVKRESRGSHRVLSRPGWPDVVFAFHDSEEIGPRMLARITKRTGLTPDDL